MNVDLRGLTAARFGPFLAQTSGTTLLATDTGRVWRVWCDADEKRPAMLAEGLKREDAMRFAQACARYWRAMGSPILVEVGVTSDGRVVINGETLALNV